MSENAYEYKQKIYRYDDEVKEWIYYQKVHAEHIVQNPDGDVRHMVSLNGFFETPEKCEIDRIKRTLKSLRTEKHIVSNKLLDYQQKVKEGENLLNKVQKKIENTQRQYKYLQENYPEEFI
jgi:chromosome segregation ATPase